jgi:selenocysteine-specific elongation factor
VHQPVVLGTAGHVDHGKTSLVRALTGIDTDRLPVEKARGITTELGFAKLDLGGRRVAVIDVPGHERFVKSMVAGATGLDLVCLVVAADEGVMPQTREHLDICDLLGVRRGIVALTKRDAVDAETAELAADEVRAAIAGTFLEGAAIVPVSSTTGAGLDELRAALAAAIDSTPPRQQSGVFRLPVDRVFTVKGFGTIVTGTVLGGEVAVGDELRVLPTGLPARVRGVEVHGAAVPRAIAGHRAAVNLGGVAVDELARGDVVVHEGKVAGSHILDVELRYLATAPGPLRARTKVLVHHGTTHALATLHLVGVTSVAPGGTCIAQLRLDARAPLAALPGDRFIVRGFAKTGAGTTLGGGTIVRVLAPKARAAGHAEVVAQLSAARLPTRILLDTRAAAAAGLALADLVRRTGVPAEELAAPLATLVAGGELLFADRYVHAETVAHLEQQILAKIAGAPLPREELRTQLPAALSPRVYDALLDGLVRRGALDATADRVGKAAPAPPRVPALAPGDAELLAKLRGWACAPPAPKDLHAALGVAPPVAAAALERLLAAKLATRIKPDLVLATTAVDELRTSLLAHLAQHGTCDAQQMKDLTRASRKFSIPLAEYFDAQKVTLRVGDLRRKR